MSYIFFYCFSFMYKPCPAYILKILKNDNGIIIFILFSNVLSSLANRSWWLFYLNTLVYAIILNSHIVILCIDLSLFSCFSSDGHLTCFYYFVIVGNVTMNIITTYTFCIWQCMVGSRISGKNWHCSQAITNNVKSISQSINLLLKQFIFQQLVYDNFSLL